MTNLWRMLCGVIALLMVAAIVGLAVIISYTRGRVEALERGLEETDYYLERSFEEAGKAFKENKLTE